MIRYSFLMSCKKSRCVVFGSWTIILLSWLYFLLRTDTTWLLSGKQKHNIVPNTLILNKNIFSRTKNEKMMETKGLNSWKYATSKPCRHIAFLKVHKAGSTTAQNIFLRYGYKRNLTFVLPVPPKFLYPNIISERITVNDKNIVPPPRNKNFDILCCHVIYNRKAFQSIMPNDTVYIGIVREPSEQFISTLRYFHPPEVYNISDPNPISKFFSNPKFYTKDSTDSYVNNRMAFEFGFPESLFKTKNSTDIQTYLQKLASEFSLVIVVEYFDESVILMRRILHWDIKDILYVKKNEFDKTIKLTLKDKQRHRQWAVLEYALYDVFFKRLWDQISGEGPDFFEELLFFKYLRSEVTDFCSGNKTENIKEYIVKKSKWNDKFKVTEYDCELMFKGEIELVQAIRKRQYGNITYGM